MKNNINKKLNIVFLDFDDIRNPLLAAGQARATLEVGRRLAQKGHRISVLSSKYPGYKNRKENGIYYSHIGLGTNNIRLNNIIYILTLPFHIRNIKNVDIVIECFTSPVSTLFSPLFTKTPVVALPTSFEAERFSQIYHFPFSKIEKFGLRFYKYFMPYTKFLEQKMKKVNPNIISKIIPEGVSEDFFRIKAKKPKHILFLGRLDMSQKGIDLLINAYAKIKDQIEYPLIIAGNGPDKSKIEKLIRNLKLEEQVIMVGPVYGKKKNEYLSESLFVAFPSRHEGFSLFSLEALASGLPMVGFDIPALAFADEKVALKAKAFNIKHYSELLLKATEPQVNRKLKLACRKMAKKYTWKNVASEFEKFFYNVKKLEQKGIIA